MGWLAWRVWHHESVFPYGITADAEPAVSVTGSGAGCPRFSDATCRPAVRTGLLITLLLVTAHFMAFTFIRPVLQRDPQLQAHELSGLLALYGIAGIAGNFILGLLSGRHLFSAIFCITGGITLSLAGLLLLPAIPVFHIIILTLWGVVYGGVSVTLMNWMIRYSAQAIEITGALYIAFLTPELLRVPPPAV